MIAYIVAGGLGTRSKDQDIPKSLILVQKRRLIEWQIVELLSSELVSEIVLILGHFSNQIIEYVTKTFPEIVEKGKISFSIEEQPLGTAGQIKNIFKDSDQELAFVCLGDILPRGGISESLHILAQNNLSTNVIFAHPNNHIFDSDSLEINENNEVMKIDSKNSENLMKKRNFSPVGFFTFRKRDLVFWPKSYKIDLINDVVPNLIKNQIEIFAFRILRRSIDIGTPERQDCVNYVVNCHGMYINQLIFMDRDETLIEDPVRNNLNLNTFKFSPKVIDFIRSINTIGVPIVCVTNQPHIAKNVIKENQVKNFHSEIDSALAELGVYIDLWKYCPHHPDKGFEGEIKEFKISCECRKPKAGMLLSTISAHDFPSWNHFIIGDSEREISIELDNIFRIHFQTQESCEIIQPHFCSYDFDSIFNFIKSNLKG